MSMSKRIINDDELERWAQTLPHYGPDRIPKASLDRVSIAVATRLAHYGERRSSWQRVWQPVFTASFTVLIAGWLVLGNRTMPLKTTGTPPTAEGLLATLAPHVDETNLSKLSPSDVEQLFSDETTPSTNTDIIKTISEIDFDPDTAVEQMTPSEMSTTLKTIANDRNLEWSALL